MAIDKPADPFAVVERLTSITESLRDSVVEESRVRAEETAAAREETAAARAEIASNRLTIRYAYAAIALAVLVGLLGFGKNWYDQRQHEEERVKAAVVTCLNANVTRQAIDDRANEKIIALINGLTDVGQPATTDEVTAARRQFVNQLVANFLKAPQAAALAPRDCSPKAAVKPATITPGQTTTSTAG